MIMNESEAPKVDFNALDAITKKVLAFKPKKKQNPNAQALTLRSGPGVPSEPGRES